MHRSLAVVAAVLSSLSLSSLASVASAAPDKVAALRSQVARGYSARALRAFDHAVRLGQKPLVRGGTGEQTSTFENATTRNIIRHVPNTLRSGHLNYQQAGGGLQQLASGISRPGPHGAQLDQRMLVELDGKQFRSRVEVSRSENGRIDARRTYEHHESGGKHLRVVSDAITVQRGDKTTVELNRSSLVLFGKLRLPLGRMYPGLPRKGAVKK